MLLISFYFTKVSWTKQFRTVWFHWRLPENLSAGFHKGAWCTWSSYEGHSLSGAICRSTPGVMSVPETLLRLFLQGNGEAKPLPAHTVTGAKKSFIKQKRTNHKPTIYQPKQQTRDTPVSLNNSHYQTGTENKLRLKDAQDSCACTKTRTRYYNTRVQSNPPSAQNSNLSIPAKPAQLHAWKK